MTRLTSACAAGALMLASIAAAASPAAATRIVPVPGTDGRFVYDGRLPPSCDTRKIRLRHSEGDGHATGHEHLGHGHRWLKKNYKGHPTKPPCYVRRVSGLAPAIPPDPAGADAATRLTLAGEPS